MRSNILEAISGAFILFLAGLFFSFAYKNSGIQAIEGYRVLARFDRIDGLLEGNDVRMSGVKIGSISKISLDLETYLAQVVLSIDKKIKLPTDTSAQIVSESLMGGKYVALIPGAEEDYLKAGDTIINTQSAISLEGLIGKFLFSKSDEQENATNPSTPH